MAFKELGAVIIATVTSSVVFAASPKQPLVQPTEVKIVSVPVAQPSEVKIISTPPAQPTEVKVISAPADEVAKKLVNATWVLVFANIVLCLATFGGSMLQNRDLRLRDRAAMEREIKRGAHKNMTVAIWLHQMALEIPALVSRIHRLAVNTEVPEEVGRDVEYTLKTRQKRLSEITDTSMEIVSKHALNFEGMSDKAARTLLGIVDTNDVELESMRDEITSDRARFEREITALLQNVTALQAAEITRTGI
jgi:hypothetical protein